MRLQLPRLACAMAFILSLVSTMYAAIRFERAEPAADSTVTAPPPSIQVWFTEPPQLDDSTSLELRGPSGRVELAGLHTMDGTTLMAFVADKMPDGKYTVAWRTAGSDGQVQKGEFAFTLKRAP